MAKFQIHVCTYVWLDSHLNFLTPKNWQQIIIEKRAVALQRHQNSPNKNTPRMMAQETESETRRTLNIGEKDYNNATKNMI